MPTGFDKQFSKFGNWLARLPFSGLRSRLLLLLLLTLLPVYAFISYSVIEARQQAAEQARENALWLTCLLASEQKSLIEMTSQALPPLPPLGV